MADQESSPLLVVDPALPEFEAPDPLSLPPEERFDLPELINPVISPLYRNAARRAVNELRPHFRVCPHQEIWVIALNHTCQIIGKACVAQGGIDRISICLPDLITKARIMSAIGIILVENRPGPVDTSLPIDAEVSLKIAIVCELLGMPLVEHVYINSQGYPLFVRERGMLTKVPQLLATLREGSAAVAIEQWKRGACDDDYYEQKTAARAAAAAKESAPVDITVRRRRKPGRDSEES